MGKMMKVDRKIKKVGSKAKGLDSKAKRLVGEMKGLVKRTLVFCLLVTGGSCGSVSVFSQSTSFVQGSGDPAFSTGTSGSLPSSTSSSEPAASSSGSAVSSSSSGQFYGNPRFSALDFNQKQSQYAGDDEGFLNPDNGLPINEGYAILLLLLLGYGVARKLKSTNQGLED